MLVPMPVLVRTSASAYKECVQYQYRLEHAHKLALGTRQGLCPVWLPERHNKFGEPWERFHIGVLECRGNLTIILFARGEEGWIVEGMVSQWFPGAFSWCGLDSRCVLLASSGLTNPIVGNDRCSKPAQPSRT